MQKNAPTGLKIRRGRRMGRWLLLLLLLLVLLGWRMERNLTRTVLNLASARASALAATVLHQAADEALGEGVAYDALMTVQTDAAGKIRLIQANTRQINQLTARVGQYAQQQLRQLAGQQVEVPLGSALGFTLLSGWGPGLRASILPVGTVSAALDTAFQSAGINQTRHTVTLCLQCSICLILPTGTQTVFSEAELVVAESIIVGEVPEVCMEPVGGGMWNLVP